MCGSGRSKWLPSAGEGSPNADPVEILRRDGKNCARAGTLSSFIFEEIPISRREVLDTDYHNGMGGAALSYGAVGFHRLAPVSPGRLAPDIALQRCLSIGGCD